MKVLIIGNGNIGTFMGLTLNKEIGHIDHYVREKEPRSSIVLNFNDRRNAKHKIKKGNQYEYNYVHGLKNVNEYRFILIPVSHLDFKEIIQELTPVINSNQTLVLMGNVWNNFKWFKENITSPYIYAFPNFGGAIVDDKIQGWLTKNMILGISNKDYINELEEFEMLLRKVGFAPNKPKDIHGYLITHFAYNAGMLMEAADQNGFQVMTKSWTSLKRMYLSIRECMMVANHLSINTMDYSEGRTSAMPIWWNALKTYLIFLVPGLAKSADANKNINEWLSYGEKIFQTAQELNLQTPLLKSKFG
jgi:ketopantoate reductase